MCCVCNYVSSGAAGIGGTLGMHSLLGCTPKVGVT